ncbi:MAG: hypothetical protein ACRDH6_08155 [Actinomycetota bacterium]
MTQRFELPHELTPEEERAAISALERVFSKPRPSPWALAGRLQGLRLGALQGRHQAESPWSLRAPFASRGTEPLIGRGDAK